MNDNGAFRKKRVYFSQVSNDLLRDNTISLKAKGLYALIQSYITLEGFTLYKNTLRKGCHEGEKAFESAWKELKIRGYLVQYKQRRTDGSYFYEYDLLDIIHTPKTDRVDKREDGKGGSLNNTDFPNTDSNNTDPSKKVYISLTADENSLLYIYNIYFRVKFNKDHMQIDKTAYYNVLDWLTDLTSYGIMRKDWEVAVKEHFETLPKSNNGNILAFMAASNRWFEIDPPSNCYEM